ncbi:MAG: hypothetical protein A3B74_01435 [Candidatus Kerfeldbacteria bacterium RIFCSPHIGHO2_02_FULL_42_14]|uniref:Nucleotidyl transferase domain-containing protein n=1 Tax=Candidatus Kerfeldbacteria bacterium RIFCSPHIGHO2_02_FULL_42_14 TaxID=1798540 RepID=A0A1G2AQE0_9BACT|nr:MAG: hypothetical protein A3B74_01435 [Candidatus Kerfeldbacteria bacterium RIFCSPHIGHO2_02_FULL_42_14]OGY81222.1 MAG: hypothetical protein A3E60_02950 [Candidatus Kerfeldbacteria bacterium RIFCSPHIGHO2_12_FULL_42_13]OGY83358.1 MAG: hypothetical protein A3I91_01760 [Candidatus Kerfeldbacteria bacterium RIFCSPLOWO2_02_FULL_42_19]OGY86380.1 MAG: hypothetical protein A3G01_05280 [Candidatus Kerfeldbacteria bacterium RIFCSPLOWO2_12_FULL_43_9]
MIRKAIVAAAGRGTRMKHLSQDRPKHLIPVCGRPFLYYVIQHLHEAGIHDIVVVAGYKAETLQDSMRKYFSDIRVVNQFAKLGEERYGTACPLECVREEVSAEPFVFLYGDNLYSPSDLARIADDNTFHAVAGLHHEHPEHYGVLVTQNNFLTRIVEKPKQFVGNFINVGLYRFYPEVFQYLDHIEKSERGEYEVTDVVSLLAAKKKVQVVSLADYWFDFGKPEDIHIVEKFLNTGAYDRED